MTDKHFNPALERRLAELIAKEDWGGVVAFMDTLSNAHFRTAGYILGETLMPRMEDEEKFWTLASTLVLSNRKAFLVTIMKSAARRVFAVESIAFAKLCEELSSNDIDVTKTLANLLPLMERPEGVERLLCLLHVDDPMQRIAHLLKVETMPSRYALFMALRKVDHNTELLRRTVQYLMKRGDNQSFNLASLVTSYFGLQGIQGTFARPLQPYELSRFDSSYEAFRKSMLR